MIGSRFKQLTSPDVCYIELNLQTIATVCMFLAGKVEETPRPLRDVILVSYEIIHKKDPAASQRIKQKVYFVHGAPYIVLLLSLWWMIVNANLERICFPKYLCHMPLYGKNLM